MDSTNSMWFPFGVISVVAYKPWDLFHVEHDPIDVVPWNDDRDLDLSKLMMYPSGNGTVSNVDHDTFSRLSQIRQHSRLRPPFRFGLVIGQVVAYGKHVELKVVVG